MPSGVVAGRAVPGGHEEVWVSPQLPPASERERYPLRVALLCRFEDVARMNADLRVVRGYFHRDSWLVAIRRRGPSSELVLYTSCRAAIVEQRYLALRGALQARVVGLSTARDPRWELLATLMQEEPPQEAP